MWETLAIYTDKKCIENFLIGSHKQSCKMLGFFQKFSLNFAHFYLEKCKNVLEKRGNSLEFVEARMVGTLYNDLSKRMPT